MSDRDLAARIQRLEDIEAIRALKARYAAYCDSGYPPADLANLFTEDAVWESDMFGRHEGRAGIHAFFTNAGRDIPFAMHYMTNPIITVDGDQANGTWHLFQACTFAAGDTPIWGSGKYQERYARTADGWKFQHLILTSCFWTPFEKGWVATRFVQEER